MSELLSDKNNETSVPSARRKRGLLMIFVAIMMVSITTILAASADLSRIARLRQVQTEQDIKWDLSVESAKALAAESLSTSDSAAQNFSATVNGTALNIRTELASSWGAGNGAKVTISGTIAGKSRQVEAYLGKRSVPNPAVFGCFVTGFMAPNNLWGDKEILHIDGDLYCPKFTYLRGVEIVGDLYSSLRNQPSSDSLTGSFYAHQPGMSIALDSARYTSRADVSTSGDLTLHNPTNSTDGTRSKLYYHKGTLTIKGTVTGEITVYVSGNVIIQTPKLASGSGRDRLVVIVDGDVEIGKGTSEVVLICNGEATFTDAGSRTIKGSLACATLRSLPDNVTVEFDNYFVSDPVRSVNFRIPGQW